MERELHNLPLLILRVGDFLRMLKAIQDKWPDSRPELEKLFTRTSKSPADDAIDNFQEILVIMYDSRAGGCKTVSTRMG